MKTTRIALLVLAFAAAFAGAKPAVAAISAGISFGPSGHARVDLGFFYDDLAAYGRWSESPRYGQVWSPRINRPGWRPYQYGHWAWTDYGWTWISDEPFGWATYHYGRWYEDPDDGWQWVPGDEWAPSYVSWQEGDDYIGWAPLPPSIDIRAGFFNVSLGWDAYLFVPEGRFLDARLYDYYVPRRDCERIFYRTRNFTNYRYDRGRVFAGGVPVDRVQRVIGHRVPRYQVADLGLDQRHHARFEGSNRGDQGRWNRQQSNDQQRRWSDRQQVIDQQRWNRGQERRQEVQQDRWNRQQSNDQRWNGRQQAIDQQRWNRGQEQRQVQPDRSMRQQNNDQGRWNRQQSNDQGRSNRGQEQSWQNRQQNDGRRWQGRQQESRPQQQRMNDNRGGGGRGGREVHENRGGGRGQSNDRNDRGNRHNRDGRG